MGRAKYQPLDQLPLYPTEEQLALALLGPERAKEWPTIAKTEEKAGLPRISHQYGGRYRPAVKAFYDRRYRMLEELPAASDETEGESFNEWRHKRSRPKADEAQKRSR